MYKSRVETKNIVKPARTAGLCINRRVETKNIVKPARTVICTVFD
jgi:hypothetical protein